jgi:hypothetical protein
MYLMDVYLMHRPQASLERKHRTAITELGLCKQRLEDVKASVARQGVGSEEISRMCAKAEVRAYMFLEQHHPCEPNGRSPHSFSRPCTCIVIPSLPMCGGRAAGFLRWWPFAPIELHSTHHVCAVCCVLCVSVRSPC